jgi:hypothetical protein
MLRVPSFEKSMVMDSMFKFENFGFIDFNLVGSKFVHFKFMLKKSNLLGSNFVKFKLIGQINFDFE